MSLKLRLRLAIVGLVVTMVLVLSFFDLRTLAETVLTNLDERASMVAGETAGLVLYRINQDAAQAGPAPDPAALRRRWEDAVRTDPLLRQILRQMLQSSQAILEVRVLNAEGTVLCAVASRDVERTGHLPDYEAWRKSPLWSRLRDAWRGHQDYALTVPLGVLSRNAPPAMRVEVVISSVLIRNMLTPPLLHLALVSFLALLGSLGLAVLVTLFVSRPLERVARQIDRLAAGNSPASSAPKEQGSRLAAREFQAMESKLAVLGQQYRGVQADATQLRSNLEWMLQRLEQAVFLADEQGRLTMVGPSAERLVGRNREQLIGAPLESIFPPQEQLGAVLAGCLARREKLQDLPVMVQRPGGDSARMLLNVEPLEKLGSGQPRGAMITIHDADTRREIANQIDITTRLAAINRVTGGVAHEIKNPLNAIALHLEILKSKLRELEGADEVEAELRVIGREISRLDRVVKTFLDFTRPVELELREVNLASVAREVATLVAPQAATRQVTLDVKIAEEPATVAGDRDMLLQALLNVVNNAVESMENGGVVGIVVESCGASEWCLRVSDQGMGIAPEKKNKIFDLYYTTKPNGSGIGLAFTFRVIQLHHGRIEVISEPGQGTTFELMFPVARLPQDAPRSQPQQAAAHANGITT
jgi:PAS domain S-box-containing protein